MLGFMIWVGPFHLAVQVCINVGVSTSGKMGSYCTSKLACEEVGITLINLVLFHFTASDRDPFPIA